MGWFSPDLPVVFVNSYRITFVQIKEGQPKLFTTTVKANKLEDAVSFFTEYYIYTITKVEQI